MTLFFSHLRSHFTRRIATYAAVACVIAAILPNAHAQPQFDSPLHIVVGVATDRVARIVGDTLALKLGVPVVVDNKPGAGCRLAAQQVKTTHSNQNVLILANPAVPTRRRPTSVCRPPAACRTLRADAGREGQGSKAGGWLPRLGAAPQRSARRPGPGGGRHGRHGRRDAAAARCQQAAHRGAVG